MTTMFDSVPQSTYRTNFRGEAPTLPLIKYKTLPCLYPPGSTEPCRPSAARSTCVPIPLRQGKKMVPQVSMMPTSSRKTSTSSKTKSTAVEVQNKPRCQVFQTKFGPMDSAMINRLVTQLRYTTLAQKAGSEFALPVHKPVPPKDTQEPRADMVRFRSQKYDTRPEDWQQAVLWDRIQTRGHPLRPPTPTEQKLLIRRSDATASRLDTGRQDEIRALVRNNGLASVFERKCPGYAGYIPMCPPDTRLDDKKMAVDKLSLMAASYRNPLENECKPQTYARKGPFSKTVTLTCPLNPFNKVGQEITPFDKETKYTGMTDYLEVMSAN